MTTATDIAPFSEEDVNEAANRLMRLAELWRLSLAVVSEPELDRADEDANTPREMAFCAAGSAYYAQAVGRWPRSGTLGGNDRVHV